MKTILTYPMQVIRVQRGPPKMLLELAKRYEWKRKKYHKM